MRGIELIIFSIIGLSHGQVKWTKEVTLDKDANFRLRWASDDTQWLTMEMSGNAPGYVAIGFSPDGGMNNSDIVLGWVDSTGKAQLKDMYGVGNTKPKEDPIQNYELLNGDEKDGQTRIQFRRRWNTCDDAKDWRLADGTYTLIWAHNKEDPKLADDDGVFRPPYHFTSRGAAGSDVKVIPPKGHNELCNSVIQAFSRMAIQPYPYGYAGVDTDETDTNGSGWDPYGQRIIHGLLVYNTHTLLLGAGVLRTTEKLPFESPAVSLFQYMQAHPYG